jgi:hypothetical protein
MFTRVSTSSIPRMLEETAKDEEEDEEEEEDEDEEDDLREDELMACHSTGADES